MWQCAHTYVEFNGNRVADSTGVGDLLSPRFDVTFSEEDMAKTVNTMAVRHREILSRCRRRERLAR